MAPADPEDFLPLTAAVFHILLALADGERHGYAIMQAVAQETGGRVRLGPATLYRSIKGLLAQGLIAETAPHADPPPDDERRRYYRLTDLGRQTAGAEMARLQALLALAQSKPLGPRPTPHPGGA